MFAKCANPACPKAFDYHIGGRFFRFLRENEALHSTDDTAEHADTLHPIEYYWLCERCAKNYTLVYIEGAGVVLKPRWKELPTAEILKELVGI